MDGFDEQIREIKIHRSPECWLYDLFTKLIVTTHPNHLHYYHYMKNNKVLFDYSTNLRVVRYNFDEIYIVLKEKYYCEHNKINDLLSNNINRYIEVNKLCFITTDKSYGNNWWDRFSNDSYKIVNPIID